MCSVSIKIICNDSDPDAFNIFCLHYRQFCLYTYDRIFICRMTFSFLMIVVTSLIFHKWLFLFVASSLSLLGFYKNFSYSFHPKSNPVYFFYCQINNDPTLYTCLFLLLLIFLVLLLLLCIFSSRDVVSA